MSAWGKPSRAAQSAETPGMAKAASDEPLIYIIVLNWNGKEDTLTCLSSVTAIKYPNFRIIVVDNGSSDGSVQAIRAGFPGLWVIETGENLGYAGGNNVGIRHALEHGANYVFLLNNDTRVAPDILERLLEAAYAIPDAGVLGAKIYYLSRPDAIWYVGAEWQHEQSKFAHRRSDNPALETVKDTDYVCGCAFFVPAPVFEKVGLLDETFFLTYEETDWCYRARQAGFRILVATRAEVWHAVSASFGGETSPLASYFMYRNRLLWAHRHLAWRQVIRAHLNTFREIWRDIKPRSPLMEHGSLKQRLWTATTWYKELRRRARMPTTQARLLGVRDFFLGRFGDCPPGVRLLGRK
jgi:GT2 family glycosyltransferase